MKYRPVRLNILYIQNLETNMLKLNHLIQDFLISTRKQIIEEGDTIELVPIRGRKKTFKLNRSNYEIRLIPTIFEISRDENIICIPSCNREKQTIYLTLNEENPFNAYYIKSDSDNFFIYNGRITNFSFLRNGDDVNLGFNLLKFKKKITSSKEKENFILDSEINSDLSILIQGETGTGKTTLAKEIHDKSNRYGNFVHLNLSAFSKGLIESELFGHAKGAFTGALSEKRGAILEAHNGTLFLDEIDSIEKDLQTKLLTFLDNNIFRQVGGGERKADVRIIYSSGQDLKELVREGRMRADFYYRIVSGHCVTLPSLRDNREYCQEKIEQILDEYNCSIARDLLAWYLDCPWYGNLRQLKFHLKKKIVKSKSVFLRFDDSDLSLKTDFSCAQKIFENKNIIKLADVKKEYIKQVLHINNGNYKLTSMQIGVSENTVRRCV